MRGQQLGRQKGMRITRPDPVILGENTVCVCTKPFMKKRCSGRIVPLCAREVAHAVAPRVCSVWSCLFVC